MNAILSCKFYSTLELDLSRAFKFTFISNQVDANICVSMLLNFSEPILDIFKSFITRDIVGEEDAVGTSVENSCHWLERLLTGLYEEWKENKIKISLLSTYSIPNLKLDDFAVKFEAKSAEFDSNCHLMLLLKFIVHNTFHEAWFADTSVSDDDQLEGVIHSDDVVRGDHLEWDSFDLLDLTLFHFNYSD